MKKTAYEIFEHAKMTLTLMKEGLIEQEDGKNVITSLRKKFSKQFISEPSYFSIRIEPEDAQEWIDIIYSNPSKIITSLAAYTQTHSVPNKKFLHLLIEKFLSLPSESKKSFYETNYCETSEFKGQALVKMNGATYEEINNNIFHNLLSLYILEVNKDSSYQDTTLQKIIEDIKVVRSLDDTQFNDIYGSSIVFALKNQEVLNAKQELQLHEREDLQKILVSKLLYRKKLDYSLFAEYVKNDYVPCSIKFPKGRYVMSQYILNTISTVQSTLGNRDMKKIHVLEAIEKSIFNFKNISHQYDLSFLDAQKIMQHHESIDKWEKSNFLTRKDPEIFKALLDFKMTLQFLFNPIESSQQPKLKI